jgi:hypothetical protein
MERDNLENTDVDTTIISKCVLKVIVWEDKPAACLYFTAGNSVRFCEHGKGPSGPIKGAYFSTS